MYAERTQIIEGVVSVRDAAHNSCALPRCVQYHLNAKVAHFNTCIVRGLLAYHEHSPICLRVAQPLGLEALIRCHLKLGLVLVAHIPSQRSASLYISSISEPQTCSGNPGRPTLAGAAHSQAAMQFTSCQDMALMSAAVTLLPFESRESRIHAMPNAS